MTNQMKYVDISIGNEEDAEMVLGSKLGEWDMASAACAEQVSGEVCAVIGTELQQGNI